MGTSSLYKGPKSTVLLPSDYVDGGTTSEIVSPSETNDILPSVVGVAPEMEGETATLDCPAVIVPSSVWRDARRSMTQCATGGGGTRSIKSAVHKYTKALGGHKNAAKQASSVRNLTAKAISLFSGTPTEIRKRIEELGIRFEGRTTSEIFLDIRDTLAPAPDTLEANYTNKAINDVVAEILDDDSVHIGDINEVFNANLLEKFTCGLIKWYIYNKMISQSTLGVLKKEKDVRKINKFENELKSFIDGIVRATVPELIHSGVNSKEINSLVEELYDVTYKVMEEGK